MLLRLKWGVIGLGMALLCQYGVAKPVVNVYTSANYTATSAIKEFEKACDCQIFFNYFGDPQEMAAKLAAGATGYDLIVGTGYALQDLNQLGKLSRLDLAKIPNLKNIDPQFLHQEFDPQNSFSVPYAYTPVFLAYNATKLKQLGIVPDSWAVIFDEKYLKKLQGRVSVFDSQRNVYAAALLYLGKDPNSTDSHDLELARAVIAKASRYWARYDSTTYNRSLLNGEIWLAMSYSNDLYNALQDAKKAKLNFTLAGMLQKEGNMIELDNMVIPTAAANPQLAYLLINTILKPEHALNLAQETGASIPNRVAIRNLAADIKNTDWIYPQAPHKIFGFSAYPPQTRIMVNEVWTELKMECHQ